MADLVTIQKWSDASASASGQYFTLKDDDFDLPANIKKVYKVIMTYKSDAAVTMNVLFTYVTDGGTSFINTYITDPSVPTAATWDISVMEFSTIVECQSIRFKFSPATGTFSVNDIGIEKRPIYRRVT